MSRGIQIGAATPVVPFMGKPLGFEQLTGLSAAKKLAAVPTGALLALIIPTAQAVRWRDDGTDPTGTIGMPIATTIPSPFVYSGDLSKISFIEQAASATLNVSYYG